MEGFEIKGQARPKLAKEPETGSFDEFPPLPGNKVHVSEDEFMVIDSAMQIMTSEHQGYLGTLIQNATTKITNMYFHVVDDSTKVALESLVKSEPIMLGKKIKTVDEAVAVIQYLVYFSYRNFDYPIIYKGRKLYTDNLWGCTLRAAQMLFAVIYQKLCPNVERTKVIDLFKEYKESERSPLNIHRMCDIGSTEYTGKPGEYWNCLTSMLSLKDLLFELPNISQMLSFLCFHNNMIAFKEFEKSDFGTDEVLVIGEEPENDIEVFHTKKLVYFVCLLGEAKISEENWECLKLFFGLSTFCGMLGGVGTRAHYVYGYKDDMLLYLDPHNAQPFCSKSKPEYETYQVNTKKINCIPYKHFNPCVVLTYLLSNKKELDHFKETFQSLSNLSSYFFCEDSGRLTTSELESRFSESSAGLEIIESNLPEDPPRKDSDGISGFQLI